MDNEISLQLKIHLAQDCQVELVIRGEMTDIALEKLVNFLELTRVALKVSQEASKQPGPSPVL